MAKRNAERGKEMVAVVKDLNSSLVGSADKWREVGHDSGIRAMCDYGAREFRHGKCDGIHFKVWFGEGDLLNKYMAENHAGVPYKVSWPVWG